MIHRPPFPRPSASAVDKARILLDRALGPSKVITSADGCAEYAGDESDQDPVVPDAVVLATCANDIALALAAANEAEVPIVPRAAGSGKSGGCVPVSGGIVLVTLGMKSIKEIDRDELLAVVEPGVILADFHAAVEAEGLFYPPDPNSLNICALGGNLAENAGGPRAFKYGVTREYVLGVQAALMNGTQIRAGRRTVKGVTGYDITSLLVGSEGTLGVFTEATLQLIPKPAGVVTLLGLFEKANDAGLAVSAMIRAGLVPRCLEFMDPGALSAVRARGVPVDERAGAMLLIEVDGEPATTDAAMERIGEACVEARAIDVLVAQDASQQARLWAARRALSPATRAMARFKISEDVVVPRMRLPDLLSEIEQVATHVGILSEGRLVREGALAELTAASDAEIRIETNAPAQAAEVVGRHGLAVRQEADALIVRLPLGTDVRSTGALLNQCLCLAGISVYAFAPRRTSLEHLYHASALPTAA